MTIDYGYVNIFVQWAQTGCDYSADLCPEGSLHKPINLSLCGLVNSYKVIYRRWTLDTPAGAPLTSKVLNPLQWRRGGGSPMLFKCLLNRCADRAEILHGSWVILCTPFGKTLTGSGHGAVTLEEQHPAHFSPKSCFQHFDF